MELTSIATTSWTSRAVTPGQLASNRGGRSVPGMVTIYEGWPGTAWLCSYQIDEQHGSRQLTYLCPKPAPLCRTGGQSQGIQPTVTRPGPHGWPSEHSIGNRHQSGRCTSID